MPDKGLHVQQNENVDRGRLQVNVTSTLGLQPVVNARVGIAYTGESQRLLEELQTDSSGQTEAVTLDAPPVEYSQEPDRPQPFSEYTVTVQAEGYRSVEVSAIDVFAKCDSFAGDTDGAVGYLTERGNGKYRCSTKYSVGRFSTKDSGR